MYRKIMQELTAWKEKPDRQPLMLKGARQVGKTWILREFGHTRFDDVLEINFEKAGNLAELFEGTIDPVRIINMLGALHGKKILPQKTLLIFDEVQEVPRALTSLKYFSENAPEYAVCCAGSLLGVTLHKGTSFPVGKVDTLQLEPMTFDEFLIANDEQALCDYILSAGLAPVPQAIFEKLTDYLKLYMVTGGMPAAVSAWLTTKDFSKVEEKQRDILNDYAQDFSKHAPENIVPRLFYLWNSVPSQLAKENKKFIYGLIREGARAREYEEALLWLLDSGLLRRVYRVTKGVLPLKAYEDLKSFKLYHLDVGLLRVMSELAPAAILEGSRVFEEFKGALTEQYVLQQICAQPGMRGVYYWTSDATAEVDFVFADGLRVIPMEVKASENLRAKSLRLFREKYQMPLAMRTSLANLRLDDGLLNMPLPLLWALEQADWVAPSK